MRKKITLLFICLVGYCTFSYSQKPNPKTDALVTIETTLGNIVLVLYDQTPKHKENFIKLAKEGFYDGTTFHRIIPDFMIQGGDPNSKDSIPDNDGTGGPGYTVPNEINASLRHVYGALAAARMGDMVNPKKESSGSQFYIVQNHNGTSHLDNSYTVFGQVISGQEVVDKIALQPKDFRDRPLQSISMKVSVKTMKRKKIIKKFGAKNIYER